MSFSGHVLSPTASARLQPAAPERRLCVSCGPRPPARRVREDSPPRARWSRPRGAGRGGVDKGGWGRGAQCVCAAGEDALAAALRKWPAAREAPPGTGAAATATPGEGGPRAAGGPDGSAGRGGGAVRLARPDAASRPQPAAPSEMEPRAQAQSRRPARGVRGRRGAREAGGRPQTRQVGPARTPGRRRGRREGQGVGVSASVPPSATARPLRIPGGAPWKVSAPRAAAPLCSRQLGRRGPGRCAVGAAEVAAECFPLPGAFCGPCVFSRPGGARRGSAFVVPEAGVG